jgi:manganese/zinc/iron transport system ATP- binding protein
MKQNNAMKGDCSARQDIAVGQDISSRQGQALEPEISSTPQPALRIEKLVVNYGKRVVLEGVDLEIPQGEMVALVGPNGAGKSTLLKASLGLIKPLSGKVQFLGQTLKKSLRKKISYVPQKESIDWDFPLTVFDLVLMGRYPHLGLFLFPSHKDKELAWKYLRLLQLESVAGRQISELSGGQQQRAFMARALAQEAEIYLMDEPFTGVDVHSKEIISQILRQLRGEGKTILIVHHDLASIPQLFDWVIFLNRKIVAVGEVKNIFTKERIEETFKILC